MYTARVSWPLLALLVACGDDGHTTDTTPDTTDTTDGPGPTDTTDTPGPTDDPTEPTDAPSVLQDCPVIPGNICPYIGVGVNGFNGDDVGILDVWLSFPQSIAFSPLGPPVLSDWNNHKLRAVEEDPADGLVTVMGTDFLGDGDPLGLDKTVGAPGTTVALNHPTQQMYNSLGLLVSDSWHTHKVRTWDPATGLVKIAVGGSAGNTGLNPEPIVGAKLNQPKEIWVDSKDNLWILDMRNQRIRYIDFIAATITTIAGSGTKDHCGDGGPATAACFAFPSGGNPEPGGAIAVNAAETIMYVADPENHVIRAIDLVGGTISTIAGTPETKGDVDGTGAAAMFNYPTDLALDGNELFIADANNHKIRKLDLTTMEVTTFVGTGLPACEMPYGYLVPQICDNQHDGGDGGPAIDAELYRPFGVELDLDGNLVIADTYDHRFRIVYR